MNISDYIYKAVNWIYPNEDKVTEGNIPTGKDYLSDLPPEILIEMMMHLPLESVHALKLTNRKIMPTTKPVIQFKTNLKTQELLESFDIDSSCFKGYFSPEKQKTYKEDIEKAKTLQNGSNERIQALRNAICSIYQGKGSLNSLLSSPLSYDEFILKDKLLVEQMMKSLTFNNDLCKLRYNYDEINNEIVFLNLLKTNQIHLKDLQIEIFNVTSVPEEFIEALVGALRENQSINKVCISWQDCDLLQLDAILEAIKNNERIVEFKIRDGGPKRNCQQDDWRWERSAKVQSYKEFEDLIKYKLNDTFQIPLSDTYGFYHCERLSEALVDFNKYFMNKT